MERFAFPEGLGTGMYPAATVFEDQSLSVIDLRAIHPWLALTGVFQRPVKYGEALERRWGSFAQILIQIHLKSQAFPAVTGSAPSLPTIVRSSPCETLAISRVLR